MEINSQFEVSYGQYLRDRKVAQMKASDFTLDVMEVRIDSEEKMDIAGGSTCVCTFVPKPEPSL